MFDVEILLIEMLKTYFEGKQIVYRKEIFREREDIPLKVLFSQLISAAKTDAELGGSVYPSSMKNATNSTIQLKVF